MSTLKVGEIKHESFTGTTQLKLDSAGRLMVGTDTKGQADADDFTVANSGSGGITIRTGNSNNANIFFSDATSGSAEYAGYLQYKHDQDRLDFGTATSTRMTIDSSGNLVIKGSATSDNNRMQIRVNDTQNEFRGSSNSGTSRGFAFYASNTNVSEIATFDSDGLKFGTDTAAANALDDYEEGTFTPSLVQGYSNITYNTQAGFYTKIGRFVSYSIYLYVQGATGDNAEIRISLPFTTVNTQFLEEGAYIVYDSNFLSTSNDEKSNCYIMSGRNYTYLRLFKNHNAASIYGNDTTLGTGANNSYLLIKGFLTTS